MVSHQSKEAFPQLVARLFLKGRLKAQQSNRYSFAKINKVCKQYFSRKHCNYLHLRSSINISCDKYLNTENM